MLELKAQTSAVIVHMIKCPDPKWWLMQKMLSHTFILFNSEACVLPPLGFRAVMLDHPAKAERTNRDAPKPWPENMIEPNDNSEPYNYSSHVVPANPLGVGFIVPLK